MIKFNRDELRDRIYACWLGKNIGGTLGTPFESQQKMNDCTGFTSEAGQPLPNDDLDLQLIWLKALSEVGPKALDCKVLGEYWLEYITPYWNEYGICKANMKRGIVPPMSGQYCNYWKHSNGAWIRTEVWATVYPGDVERATHFAYEDACVDHGSGEGTYAAIFVAAIESAAFVIHDLRKLIDIGLSKIPRKSRMYKFITKVLECYDNGMDWKETRNIITDMALADEELGWFQAPANVGYTVIGLLYGENDFKKSILIACNCGDDTDCTCATAGALLGIMNGTSIIPEDWREYIGDSIVTVAINAGASSEEDKVFMASCSALTDKIMAVQAVTLSEGNIIVSEADQTDISEADAESYMDNEFVPALSERSEYYMEYKSSLADCLVEYSHAPEILPNGTIGIKLSVKAEMKSQKIYSIDWILPEGWQAEGSRNISVMYPDQYESAEYILTAPERVLGKNTVVLSISCEGHFDTLMIPVVLLG